MFFSEFFFPTTRELEYLFFLSRKSRIFFTEFNIRLYDKNSEQIILFPPPKSEYFFQQHWESKKNHTPPPFKLNGRSQITSYWVHILNGQPLMSVPF
jgi:hypothetical protein